MTHLIPLAACLVTLTLAAHPAPPDLHLEWVEGGRPETGPVEGRSGETRVLTYRVRNVGGSDAYAVLLRAHTALGALGAGARLRPGPRAGEEIDRQLSLPLARGMREVCIEGRLQTLRVEDPEDPNPRNNRACRRVRIVEPEGGASPRYHHVEGVSP